MQKIIDKHSAKTANKNNDYDIRNCMQNARPSHNRLDRFSFRKNCEKRLSDGASTVG